MLVVKPCLQVPICLVWVITIHKSQGLTLQKVVIDIGKKEYAAGQSFVTILRVRAFKDILFSPFSFERLQRIKSLKRLEERIEEESRLMTLQNSRFGRTNGCRFLVVLCTVPEILPKIVHLHL
ncbi:hypothetical protein RhiirA4_191897 [Rhizophagus irregularis]|uniref:Uncharacterized protein n=1 Tax=Rhizophagus irregularis TaxID=588596 RepID=A0A2I1GJ25_9GLOM|nr:hypothetical protein RhiirA4_191897 [Rhizophagus irregularis]